MPIAVKMPQLGESVTEGTVGTWLKEVGEYVEKYDPLLEVISDKVDTEVTATDAGTLLSIEVEEGETVPVGTVLCYLGEDGEAPGDAGESDAPAAEPEPEPTPQPEPEPEPEPTQTPQPAAQPAARPAAQPAASSGGAAMITPVVARMIAEHNIDVSQVAGTGRDGRVTKRDIETYLESQQAGETVPPAASVDDKVSERAPEEQKAPAPTPTPEPREAPAPTPAPEPKEAPAPERREAPAPPARRAAPQATQQGEVIPMTNMRRRIAEHMVASKRTSPHVTTVFEVDLSAVAAHRSANKEAFAKRGARLTYMAYFVEAVASALQRHQTVNATFTEDGIFVFGNINIGMAAAVRGGAGLVVPVIRNADGKNLLGLAMDVADLTERARTNNLTPDDMAAGTFTITNHGASGSLWGTPIINQPQSAIMGIGKIEKRVKVINDAIAIRQMCYLSLTFDHRVLDGASADAFMMDVIAFLEGYSA